MKNSYKSVVNHKVVTTENPKVMLVVQSMSHDDEVDFVDVRKFRTYGDFGELKFTNKGIHFSKDQLSDVIEGLLDAYSRINDKDVNEVKALFSKIDSEE